MPTLKPNLTRTWAAGAPGANVVDPDTTTPGKFDAGWLAEVPPFEHFNFLQKLFTQGLAHNNEQGINVWDTNTTYPTNGLAKSSDGVVYKSVLEQSGNDPISDNGTNWLRWVTSGNTFATMAELVISTDTSRIYLGSQITVGDRGDSKWDVVLASGVADDIRSSPHSTGLSTLAFKYRINGDIHIKHLGGIADYKFSDESGSLSGAIANHGIVLASQNFVNFIFDEGDSVNEIGYGIEETLIWLPLVGMYGIGDSTMIFQATDVEMFKLDLEEPGTDYIRIGKMHLKGGRSRSYTTNILNIKGAHVPVTLEHLIIEDAGLDNIHFDESSVITLDQVWSIRAHRHALYADSFRSLHVIGGAYESSITDNSIFLSNSREFKYPTVTFTSLHTEGMATDNLSALELVGGATFDGTLVVTIHGWQVIVSNPIPVNNYALVLGNDNVNLSFSGIGMTGETGFANPSNFPANTILPANGEREIAHFDFFANKTIGRAIYSGTFGRDENHAMQGVVQGSANIDPFGVTQQVVNTGVTMPDTNYNPSVTVENYLGDNLNFYIDTITTTSFRLNFVNTTTGALGQLQNTCVFHWSIPVKG